jgi:Zn-dependent protease
MAQVQPSRPFAGTVRLFKTAGISVHLHWSWLVVAYFELQYRTNAYASQLWNVAEYLSLFGIVLLHEFGHALACRQVGGKAEHIILWPLGGIAFVNPPPKPGAWLWSIAAGPLVNVILVPVTFGAFFLVDSRGWAEAYPDVHRFIWALAFMNFVLLLFNLLPVYPLDGGQILQSILWFMIGRWKSLLVVSVIGLIVGLATLIVAVVFGHCWFIVLAAFAVWRSLAGFQQARSMAADGEDRSSASLTLRPMAPEPGPTVEARCEECGAVSLFPAAERGTVQTCPTCGASMDVGPVEGDWWQGVDEQEGDGDKRP